MNRLATIKNVVMGSSLQAPNFIQFIWLVFRVHIGLSMAIDAGFGKIQHFFPPEWFVKQVGEIGFTFISPTFWAFLSGWGEFLGGLLIAFGLLTRLAAFQLAFQFFVISFIWYKNPMPVVGMYYQQLLFWGYILVAALGSGKFSIDYLILTKKIKKATTPIMPKIITACLFFLLWGMNSNAQDKPLTGSGRIVNETFNYKNFDKIKLEDIVGMVTIEVGKPFAIDVDIDDNLQPFLQVTEMNGVLIINFKGNKNNKLYIENTNVDITIFMPEIAVVINESNSNVKVKNINASYFRLESKANGSSILVGNVDEFDLIKRGNGNVDAKKLIAKTGSIKKTGNGNVAVSFIDKFVYKSAGNGNTTNYGKGIAIVNDEMEGNGKLTNFYNAVYKEPVKLEFEKCKAFVGKYEGKLSYKNYSDNKEMSIEAAVEIVINETDKTLTFNYSYNKEPNHEHSTILQFDEKGFLIGKAQLLSYNAYSNELNFTLQEEGLDNDKTKLFNTTYTFSKNAFYKTKKVLNPDTNEWFIRNWYSFNKMK